MPESLDRLRRDRTLVAVALGVAIGTSLWQVATGISSLVTTLLKNYPSDGYSLGFEPLTWRIGTRVVALGGLVGGLIELTIVLLVAAWVYRRGSRSRTWHADQPTLD